MSVIAITGATGFVGSAVLAQAAARGVLVRALTRRAQPQRAGMEWIAGALDDAGALDQLVRGASAVIHIAGVVNAPDRAGFLAGNGAGTQALVQAMAREGVSRLVHVSSLAAREPGLSDYGWSKAEAEAYVRESDLDWTMVRPPAVYGPGDAELLELFRMARLGVMLLPPGGKLSIIHVDDLAALLLALGVRMQDETRGATYEVSDDCAQGWSHQAFAQAIGQAVGRRAVKTLAMPAALLKLGARLDRALRGERARLTPDRAAYFCHDDWVANPNAHVPSQIWRPAISAKDGLAATALAYRARGRLR